MKCRTSPTPRRVRHAAFTVFEFVIAMALTVLLVAMVVLLSEGTGKTLVSITSQASHNQYAGNGIEFMVQRIRLANTASNDSSGNVLTLSFDDNPEVDSNGDQTTWNDKDHYEQFVYKTSDSSWTTLEDNYIGYKANSLVASTNIIVPSSVRQLSGQKIFQVSSNTVTITFGLITTNMTAFSQAIEIRTKATFRNKTG